MNMLKKFMIALNVKTFKKYNDLYVKGDVLLLADIFGAYRKRLFEIYDLDPLHCLSAPGYSNRAMLKKMLVQKQN